MRSTEETPHKGQPYTGAFGLSAHCHYLGNDLYSTKVLLADFQPAEPLFFRFLIGLLALLVVCPHRLWGTGLRQELTFASVIVLHEKITVLAATGTVLTLVGLLLSESKLPLRKEAK